MKSRKIATSIVEAMVIILIITMGVLGVYEMYIRSLRVTNNLENKVQAIQIAREGIEAMSNIRDTNWLKFASDKKNCWLTLNYIDSCIGKSTSANLIKEDSYIIYRDNHDRWILESNYLNKNYRDFFKVRLDENGLYTQSGGVKDMTVTFTREIKITATEAFPGEALPYKNAINVKSIVRWIDASSSAPQEVLLETVLTNYDLSHGQGREGGFYNVGTQIETKDPTPPTCGKGKIWNGETSSCEPNTRTYTCKNLPDNAVWTYTNTTSQTVTQTTVDLIIRTPLEASLTPKYSVTPRADQCYFKCAPDYKRNSTNKSCEATVNGACRTGTITATAPTGQANLCSAGTASPTTATANGDNWIWKCNSTNGGTNANCSRPRAYCATQPNYPNANFTTGTPTSTNQVRTKGATNCGFTCKTGYAGTTCSEAIVNGVCKTGTITATAPTGQANLCSAGTASPTTATASGDNWTWTCAGENGGTTLSCSRPRAYCATYTGGNGTLRPNTPTASNQVVQGTSPTSACYVACNTGYAWDDTIKKCVSNTKIYTCTGLPANAVWTYTNTTSQTVTQTLLGGKRSPTEASLVATYSTTSSTTACRYKCKTGYVWNSSSSTCISNTRTGQACTGIPNTTAYERYSATITQTTTNGTTRTPSLTGTYSAKAVAGECRYKCKSGYYWNGSQCLVATRTQNCTPLPTNGVRSSNGATGTKSITQTTTNGTTRTPSLTATSNAATDANQCYYKCALGWTGTNCDQIDTWTDPTTLFVWERYPSTSTFQWAANNSYAEPTWNSTTKTYSSTSGVVNSTNYPAFARCTSLGTGWRLPTKHELTTLVNYTKYNPATDHPSLASGNYWSSTEDAYYTSNAWYVLFYVGNTYNYRKAYTYCVVCIHD